MKIKDEIHVKKKNTIKSLQHERRDYWLYWRDLAEAFIPRRYVSLLSAAERKKPSRNPNILNSIGTSAARTLASGMMNGITSPSRPWFKLRIPGFADTENSNVRRWLDEVERIMLVIMAESNFYNALAIMYIDLVVFGTSAMLIYEDDESIIRCYNQALGEYYIGQSNRRQVDRFAREYSQKLHQVVDEFGIENVSESLQAAYRLGGGNLYRDVGVTHLIEPNVDKDTTLGTRFKFREIYWETAGPTGTILREAGFHEMPGIFPRWEISGNSSYGDSPGMDAYGDVIQLQHETKKKGQSLDFMNQPPIVADVQLEHKPMALLPRGRTFVSVQGRGVGDYAKPIYQINPPIAEMTADLQQIEGRIREIFHNDLFRMISQLDTVRSATEIDARREEKLVLLGPVLERFESEGLDPSTGRIFNIGDRAGLFPTPPEEIADRDIEIQYVSILAAAQRAVGTIAVERWLALIGEIANVHPNAAAVPNFDELIRGYGRDVGVPARYINSKAEAQDQVDAANQAAQASQAVELAATGAEAAKNLSQTDVGGGRNVLQEIIGG